MVEPLEKTEPELALLIKNYVNINPLFQYKPRLKSKREYLNKLGRNDPCVCGSGKKYKKCCI